MGLDMYLYHYDKDDEHYVKEATKPGLGVNKRSQLLNNIWDYAEEVAYWRKANAIHDFFVRECPAIEDGTYHLVSREDLGKLLEKCFQILVLKDKEFSKDTLPTCDGFFFGPVGYDAWYYETIQDTVSQLTKVLAQYDDKNFLYHASW